MCSGIIGQKCGTLGTCAGAQIWYSCENLGYKCVTCVDALMNGERVHGLLLYNEHGEFACILVLEESKGGLQMFDKIIKINNIAADLFFDKKYNPQASVDYMVTTFRDGAEGCLNFPCS